MSLIRVNWEPPPRQLRQFGLICLAALPLLGWLWGAAAGVLAGLLAVGMAAAVLAVVAPRALKYPFLGLTIAVYPVGLVVGEVVMASIYFLVITPLGLLLRLFRGDALGRVPDRAADSYWGPKETPSDVARYYRQY